MPKFSVIQAHSPTIRLMIASQAGPVELDRHSADLPLPQGPDGDAPLLHYGPYLTGLRDLLLRDGSGPLIQAVSRRSGLPVSATDLRGVDIISEKHGALYNVACARVFLADRDYAFALTSAVTDFQKAVMTREAQALQEVQAILGEDLLPHLRFEGEAEYLDKKNGPGKLKVLITDWLDDFHEFHLCRTRADHVFATEVWHGSRGKLLLTAPQAAEAYRKAARLLTLCYDNASGRQVYPWHHAAGDFVIRCDNESIDVRLITVRDYKRLIHEDGEEQNPLLSLLHFFLNLTLRMRLDRLEGTGELAWMGRSCLDACAAGFLDACRVKHAQSSGFPDAPEILGVLQSFEETELYELLQIAAADGLIEPDEAPFLAHHLAEHASELSHLLVTLGA